MKKILILFLFLTLLPVSRANAVTTELIKGESFSAVYYKSVDGKRYVFPNQRVYNSWYADFSSVKIISDAELANIPIGGSVSYKPNSRLVKITTDPKVYWVSKNGVLRWVTSENLAKEMFGENWGALVDDLPDAFFAPPNYTLGEALIENNRPFIEENWTIDDNKQYQQQEQNPNQEQEQGNNQQETNVEQQTDPINLTAYLDTNTPTFKWSVGNNDITYGFMLIKSANKDVVYPGDAHVKLDSSITQYDWIGMSGATDSYYRLCILNEENFCAIYSDEESLSIGTTNKIPQIILSGKVENNIIKLIWKREWLNAKNGFYLMRGENENPEFASSIKFGLDKEQESYNWQGLDKGTYHFRVCNYTGTTQNGCEYYSNDLKLTITN
ncbi:MAG: hypothetical protein WC389_18625 [Lutibacter sp.]|jgi:hypothetical protein